MASSTQTQSPSLPYDAYAHYGRNLIQEFDEVLRSRLPPDAPLPQWRTDGFPPPIPPSQAPSSASTQDTVGILGAGAGGLYTALILEDLGIPYKILEAREEVGGRLRTYKFPNPSGAPYNFFEAGAMRFPKIDAMRRVFHLFDYINLKPVKFRFNSGNALYSYNGITFTQDGVPSGDAFESVNVIQDTSTTDANKYILAGPKAIVNDVIHPFASRLLEDLKVPGESKGWKYLMKFDHYSTRAYMSLKYLPSKRLDIPDKSLSTDVVNWCETFGGSTSTYDRSLAETVLGAIAFGWQPQHEPKPTEWFCIDGGAQEIARSMADFIDCSNPTKLKLIFDSRVISIARVDNGRIQVVTSDSTTHQFSHVISTIPLPVLRMIDLSGARLLPMQANALRQLNYGSSVKIGMQFKTAWWTTAKDKDGKCLKIVGGQSFTDRPLRTVVYPSFGKDIDAGTTTTLTASYCLNEDATRLGALVGFDDSEATMVTFVLKELADLHNVDVSFLRDQLIDHKVWDWGRDPLTMGAFANFGPGKFKNVYASLNCPAASGHLHFAGEAISVRHGWVEGALDSAWRAVCEMLMLDPKLRRYLPKFFENWGTNPEWIKGTGSYEEGGIPKAEDVLLFDHCLLVNPELASIE